MALCALVALRAATGTARAEDAQPNVVVILTDDMNRWDLAQMPNVEQLLAAHGVTYTDYVANNPVCAASRASILTGLTSSHTGVWANSPRRGGYATYAAHGYTTDDLPVWMQQAGYETSLDGKYVNGFVSSDPAPAGWDDSHILLLADAQDESVKGGYYNYATVDDGQLDHRGKAPTDYSTTVLGQDAANFIEGADPTRPVFVYFAPHAPHQPATPEPAYAKAPCVLHSPRTPDFDTLGSNPPAWALLLPAIDPAHDDTLMARRCRTLLSVDDQVASIVGALTDTGRLANTLVIFASDNGFSLGQHDWVGKLVPYQESTGVPLVVRWDDDPMLTPGSTTSALVEDTDLPVAITDAGGAVMPPSDGLDFLAGAVRDEAPLEHAVDESAVIPNYCGIQTASGLQYTLYTTGAQELYDLNSDPYQMDNLAGDPEAAAVVAELRRDALAGCTPRPPNWPHKLG